MTAFLDFYFSFKSPEISNNKRKPYYKIIGRNNWRAGRPPQKVDEGCFTGVWITLETQVEEDPGGDSWLIAHQKAQRLSSLGRVSY